MENLKAAFLQNLSFVGVCVLVAVMLALLAKACEKWFLKVRQVSAARKVSILGITAALAAALHMLDFPLPFLAPGFYKVDFSEIPVLMAGFYLGPVSTVVCEALKVFLKILLKGTSTAFVGDFANFVVGCSFVLPAAVIYHTSKSKKTAVIGLVCGTISMALLGSAFNAVYLIPKFAELFHMPLEAIIAMGSSINGFVSDVGTLVLICVAPLNLVKGTAVSVLAMLLYKRVAEPVFGRMPG